ncbi:MAG: hypothetical protein ACPGN3_05505 [Opitutales bacterium]
MKKFFLSFVILSLAFVDVCAQDTPTFTPQEPVGLAPPTSSPPNISTATLATPTSEQITGNSGSFSIEDINLGVLDQDQILSDEQSIGSSNNVDYYLFYLSEDSHVSVSVEAQGDDVAIIGFLYDSDGVEFIVDNGPGNGEFGDYGFTLNSANYLNSLLTEGYYFIGIRGDGGVGDYEISVEVSRVNVSFDIGIQGAADESVSLDQRIVWGAEATAPVVTGIDGWEFWGWNKEFTEVTQDMVVSAEYFRPGSLLSADGSSILYGMDFELSVTATDGSDYSYQWFLDGTKIDGATEATYIVESAGDLDAGLYEVLITDGVIEKRISGNIEVSGLESVSEAFTQIELIEDFASASTDEWRHVDWFGLIETTSYPWLYHYEMGWVLVSGTQEAASESEDTVWVWIPGIDEWYRFSENDDPWIWSDSAQEWHYLYRQDGASWIYDYAISDWIQIGE